MMVDVLQQRDPDEGRLILGDDLMLGWAYRNHGPRRLYFTALNGAGDELLVVAVVPVQDGHSEVPDQIIAEMIQGASAAARRALPERATARA